MFQDRNATMFQDSSARMFLARSVRMFPVSSARMCQDRSVKMFPASSARMCQDRWPRRNAVTFPSRSVRMFLDSNARMFLDSRDSRSPSRSVTLLSPLMAMENKQRAFSKRINPTNSSSVQETMKLRNTSVKTNPQLPPSPFPPNFTNVEDRNYSQYSSQ